VTLFRLELRQMNEDIGDYEQVILVTTDDQEFMENVIEDVKSYIYRTQERYADDTEN